MVAEIGMITGQHEDGILEPWLLLGLTEELADSHVGIADTLVDDNALLGIHLFIFVGNDIRRMRAHREASRHKGLLHRAELGTPVLQEGLVPNAPVTA